MIDTTVNSDKGSASEQKEKLGEITVQLMVIFVVGAFFTFLRGAIFNMSGERVVARVRRRLFSAILSQEIGEPFILN